MKRSGEWAGMGRQLWNTESVFAAIVVQPDCWPAYLSPIVVPVSGTSMVCVVVMWT